MLRYIVLVVSALLAGSALAEPVFLPGSRIGLAPPRDMEPARRFTGFENQDKGAAITLIEMPPDAYARLTSELSSASLKRQGISVKSRQEITIGGKAALLIGGDQTIGKRRIRKWLLVTADPTMTALVVAEAVPGQSGYSEADMRDALKSVALRPALPMEDQIAALGFRLGDRAGFRPVRVLAGHSLLLTDGPADDIEQLEQPILVLTQAMHPPPSSEQREDFAKSLLGTNQGLQEIAIERSQSFRLKGEDWHEIVARAVDGISGRPIVLMQTIRFASGTSLRMVGMARAETRDQMLPRFRTVIDAAEIK